MADFIAFDKDFVNCFSIYDALEFKKNEINKDYYCLCSNPVFIKNESLVLTFDRNSINNTIKNT